MLIVPVLDLLHGEVVRAKHGDRKSYRPISTPLSPTSAPSDVADGLLQLHPFSTMYIADLDAIGGNGDNRSAIIALRRRFPDLRLWIDNGLSDVAALDEWWADDLGDLVVGSESQTDTRFITHAARRDRIILSLDFRADAFLGPSAFLDEPGLWPPRVIAMTLARIGGDEGPDLNGLLRLRRAAPGRSFFAAGGVRDAHDLDALAAIGAAGALVASSLHDGRLDPSHLARFG